MWTFMQKRGVAAAYVAVGNTTSASWVKWRTHVYLPMPAQANGCSKWLVLSKSTKSWRPDKLDKSFRAASVIHPTHTAYAEVFWPPECSYEFAQIQHLFPSRDRHITLIIQLNVRFCVFFFLINDRTFNFYFLKDIHRTHYMRREHKNT